MKRPVHPALLLATTLLVVAGALLPAGADPRFEYRLADFTGAIPFLGVRVRVDAERDEAFILHEGALRIFGPTGMETYSIPLDPAFGTIYDLAVDETGDIYFLGYPTYRAAEGGDFFLLRCNYRGEPLETLEPSNLPESLANFSPSTLLYADGRFYLTANDRLQIVVLNKRGSLLQVRDLTDHLPEEKDLRKNAQFGGVAVDAQGRIAVSVPIDFGVYVIAPDGSVGRFGEGGSRAGQFGVVGPLAFDDAGNIYVGDKLRSTVVVFDGSFQFVREFGGYGIADGQLVRPAGLAVTRSGRLFVSQMRSQGVAVYTLTAQENEG